MPEKQSGQLSDPGREHQLAQGKAPSGQTGVQVGRVDGKQVESGIPQQGTEPQTTRSEQPDAFQE